MRLLFVTPELTPFSGASPTGDTCGALPKALRSRGHDVTILSPLYGFIDPSARGLARRLRKIAVEAFGRHHAFEVYDARTSAGVDLLFLGHEELFSRTRNVPDGSDPEDAARFAAFCKAAVEVARTQERPFDAVHCHDWQGALVPRLMKSEGLEVPTVLTIHDVRSAGTFELGVVEALGLPIPRDLVEVAGRASLLKAGVLEASRIATISPSYARAIVREAGGLEGALRSREKDLTGITGGLDVAVWNPATDAFLESRFDPMDASGKRRNKAALQRDLELPIRDDVPLVAILGPLHPSAGLDAIARIIARIMRNDVQVAVTGEGPSFDPALATVLTEHAKRWPDRLAVRPEAPDALVHRTLAGSDAVVVAPRQPPGGSTQMRAHRYGALPIGYAEATLADTVVDCDAGLTTGTGFTYVEQTDEALLAAVQRAIAAFAQRPQFEKARARAMRVDHGWDRPAYLYERLYESLS